MILVSAGYAALLHASLLPAPRLPSAAQARAWIAQPLTEGFIVFLAQAACGVLAVYLVTAMTTRVAVRLTRAARWLAALHLPGPLQSLAAALLGATAATATAAAIPAAAAAANTADTDGQPAGHGATTGPGNAADAPQQPSATAAHDTRPPRPTYTVRRGDTLSSIAARHLGDEHRWPDLYHLNRGTHFPHPGGTLRDPNLIRPGWTLTLPTDATRAPQRTAPPPQQPETATPGPAPTTAPSTGPGTTTGAPTPAATSAPQSPTPTCADEQADGAPDRRGDTARRGISLPSGSWLDLGLALAIAAAVTVVWAHRQRRYVPRTAPTPHRLDTPDLAPMPRVIAHIRRGLRRASVNRPDLHTSANRRGADHDDVDNLDNGPLPLRPDAGSGSLHIEGEDDGQDHGAGHHPRAVVGDADSGTPLLVVPALDNPLAALWPPAGLGLTGPGAPAAARGLLTAALATGGVDHPEARTEVVIPTVTAVTLLGDAALTLPRTPRLTVTADLDEALNICEAHTMHRTRLTCQHEVDTVAHLRRADPYEQPLPPVMLIAEATNRHDRARVAALLAQGQRLDIHGVLLGDWPDGGTVTVDADGTTTPVDGGGAHQGSHRADVGRLAVLNPAETIDLLTTLAESHTGQPQAPAPSPPTPQPPAETSGCRAPATPTDRSAPAVTAQADSNADDASDGTAAHHLQHTPADVACGPESDQHLAPAESATASDEVAAGQQSTDDPHDGRLRPPVRVRVLGTPGLVDGDPQRTPRAKSLELLVYLAVHDRAASTEAILDDLLPDAPTSKAAGRLYTYVSGLRAVLRHTGGPGSYVTHPDHRYLLQRDLLDVDLWRMRAAIREAGQATDAQTRTAALRRAVDAYTGPLAEGCDYEWVEPYREAIRQDALDAHLALADALAAQPAQQIAVLDAAIAHHPHHEALYRSAMRAHAQLGHLDVIRALRRRLTHALAEIDAEPDDDTLALADRLVAQIKRTPQPSPAPAPRYDGETAA
ncbi:BTAD domain-containing putative transcriptional regulator [Micromonospora sp. A200]|uniref:BTAD domain-containing putative transcriptional regulator n=1 Tax=Micromonospora sp. A200 TaxID=2940568 RepID=UPI0024733443|nr:BTAD domain-containing putative transcriptional regulator [Micromonospora sp. A200]